MNLIIDNRLQKGIIARQYWQPLPWFSILPCFICTCMQSEEDAPVHARIRSHSQLPGAHGGASLEQEHQGWEFYLFVFAFVYELMLIVY